jgi:hypothetical protein
MCACAEVYKWLQICLRGCVEWRVFPSQQTTIIMLMYLSLEKERR